MINELMLITNGRIVTPEGVHQSDILIEGEQIKDIAPKINSTAKLKSVIDASGLVLIPGVIDTQVHFRWPGLTHKEDLASGSTAALLGGVTTYFEMPNTKPSTTTIELFQEKINQGRKDSRVDFGFFMGASGNNVDALIKAQSVEGCCGIKIFFGSSTGDLLLDNLDKIEQIFKSTNCIIAIHSEDEKVLQQNMHIRDQASHPRSHPIWRNVESSLSSTKKILEVAKKCNRRVHILHITTKDEIELLERNKQWATFEITPQHLTLSSPDCYERLGTIAQMNPPIREIEHQNALWASVQNGSVEVIGSDHAPHTLEEKARPYPNSPSGMPGVQTMLPLMLHHHLEGKLSLNRLVDLLCHNPAKLYQLNDRGQLTAGKIASIVALNLNKTHLIRNEDQASKVRHTPFHNMHAKGKIEWVMHRGQIAVKEGVIINPTAGRPINIKLKGPR
jgi:dihydroorotase